MITHWGMIGDASRAEMEPILRWLENRARTHLVRRAATVSEFVAQNDGCADLLVVLESHPDEYSTEDVRTLFAAVPTSRIVCCAGFWSESAGRSRKIWPPAVRVPVTAAIARLQLEWDLLCNQRPQWFLPATGSREEWFAAHHPPLEFVAAAPRRIRVVSPDAAYRLMLTDLLTLAGHQVVDDVSMPADVIVWDADPWNTERSPAVRRLADIGSVLAVTDWPLPEVAAELRQAGAALVLPKLGDHSPLIAALSPAD